MKTVGIILISVLSLFLLVLLILHIKSRRPFRSAVINALIGLAAFAAVNLTVRFTGVRIPVNIYTVPGCAVFGIPAVMVFVIFQVLF